MSGQNVIKTVAGYVAVNFTVASSKIFRDIKKSFPDGGRRGYRLNIKRFD